MEDEPRGVWLEGKDYRGYFRLVVVGKWDGDIWVMDRIVDPTFAEDGWTHFMIYPKPPPNPKYSAETAKALY